MLLMGKFTKLRQVEFRNALQHISFQDLSLFESVARHTSLSAAARELGLRAPFLTKAMQRLESHLSKKLLERSARGVSLTSDGLEFLQFSKSITSLMEQTVWQTELSSFNQPPFITIAGPMFLLTHLVAPRLPKALRQESQALRLIEMINSEMVATESRAHLDAAIHCDEINWGSTWQSYPLGSVEWVLCAHTNHSLQSKVTEKEVLRFPFVTPASLGPQGFRTEDDNCPVSSKKRLRLTEVSNGEIGLSVVENTDQLIFLPNIQAQQHIHDGKLRVINVKEWPPVRKTIYLSVHQDKITQPWLQRTIKSLEKGLH